MRLGPRAHVGPGPPRLVHPGGQAAAFASVSSLADSGLLQIICPGGTVSATGLSAQIFIAVLTVAAARLISSRPDGDTLILARALFVDPPEDPRCPIARRSPWSCARPPPRRWSSPSRSGTGCSWASSFCCSARTGPGWGASGLADLALLAVIALAHLYEERWVFDARCRPGAAPGRLLVAARTQVIALRVSSSGSLIAPHVEGRPGHRG